MRRFLEIHSPVLLVTVAWLMLTPPAFADGLDLQTEFYPWIEVRTPNFTVFSNAGEEIARPIAETYEQLWALLVHDFEGLPAKSPTPTYIYVFDLFSDTFPAYLPTSDGMNGPSGGYFFHRPSANYAAVVERDYRFPEHMDVTHEYVHTVLDAYVPDLPLWLEEGLAEYYSVFQIEDGEARVGYRIHRHIAWLRNHALIPLAELFALDRSSPEYDEDALTGMFYAESWMLTHMLLAERPDGRRQAMLYARLLREGVERDTAFTTAFETTYAKLEKQLRKYVRGRSFHYLTFPVSRRIIDSTEVSTMTDEEVLFRLGDLVASGLQERPGFAAEHFRAALALDETYGPASAALGRLDETAGRNEGAGAPENEPE